ncbi:MAG: 6-carboxytetrahydropterin synthase QueD [Oscillospiraceae bacterium]|nr:6-carboxytetrahydropterin synthase QueD [Oscillospiraceae bacterium]
MYLLKTEACFDSAHFLSGYEGKCANIHGHRWKIVAEVSSDTLHASGQLRGMIVDFSQLKKDVRAIADSFDHGLIYERGTLKPETVTALRSENFKLIKVDFRPTAENLASHFYDLLSSLGYVVHSVAVYETPENCAVYTQD